MRATDGTSKRLAFLHTAPVHVEPFSALVADLAPACRVDHVVDESLLRDALLLGVTDSRIIDRVTQRMHDAAMTLQDLPRQAGAEADGGAAVVVCTCSTIGGIAEQVDSSGRFLPMRIDRAMADRAVDCNGRILVVAALASTVEPTRQLLMSSAAARGREVLLQVLVVESAWPQFQRGELAAYYHTLETAIRDQVADADIVVLAQASMAPVAERLKDLDVEVLSSPRLGVQRAIEMLPVAAS